MFVTVGQPAAALSGVCSKTRMLDVLVHQLALLAFLLQVVLLLTHTFGIQEQLLLLSLTDLQELILLLLQMLMVVLQLVLQLSEVAAAALSGNVTSTVATCTQSNSVATAHISGGTLPYSYAWSNGQTGASAQGYAAGSYSVQVTDAQGCQLSLNFTVIKTNCPPNAVDDYATTLENTPVTVIEVSNDTDVDGNIDPLTVTQISSPSNGTVVLNPNGSFTYTPNANFVGSDQFNY